MLAGDAADRLTKAWDVSKAAAGAARAAATKRLRREAAEAVADGVIRPGLAYPAADGRLVAVYDLPSGEAHVEVLRPADAPRGPVSYARLAARANELASRVSPDGTDPAMSMAQTLLYALAQAVLLDNAAGLGEAVRVLTATNVGAMAAQAAHAAAARGSDDTQ